MSNLIHLSLQENYADDVVHFWPDARREHNLFRQMSEAALRNPAFPESMFGGGAFEAKKSDFGFSRRHFFTP
ncbi:MAG: hypothetical protein H6573_27385 [Lewinellaceae bacterium]|nr:hypothetical protein [Lewinellaceae bacterium]